VNAIALAGIIWGVLLAIGFEMRGGTLLLLGFLIAGGCLDLLRQVGGWVNLLF
jgi:hypothetical protein